MMEISLGEMLKNFRREREIKAETICEGLCERTLLSYYESGKIVPDILLFTRFMERMGVSPELFAIMLSEKEFKYFKWKEKIQSAIEKEEWDQVGLLLEKTAFYEDCCNQRLVRQFYCYSKAIYMGAYKNQFEEAAGLIKEAIEQTIPDMHSIFHKELLLGTTEIHMIILYLYYGILGKNIGQFDGRRLFEEIEKYISNDRMEIAEKAKVYPKLICLGTTLLKTVFTIEEQLMLCHKAIELLRKDKTFYDITTLLERYMDLLPKVPNSNISFYQKQYETFCDILYQNRISTTFRPELLIMQTPRIFMIPEYFSSERKEKRLTQESLSEGICEPETYSRIERGKRSPSKKNVVALAERLGINWCYFRGELDAFDLKPFQLRRKLRDAEIEGDFGKSLLILQEIESLIDMDRPVNYQAVKSCECILKFFMKELTAAETYECLEDLLQITTVINLNSKYVMYYSQTELEIIGDMARMLRIMGKGEEGIRLLETVLAQMTRSTLGYKEQWNGVDFVLRILGEIYFANKAYDKEKRVLQYVYKTNAQVRRGANLPTILDSLADNLEHTGRQYSEEYKKLYRQTYYVADFYHIKGIKKGADKYYRENFDNDILWYSIKSDQ